jgi:hypothetical protein
MMRLPATGNDLTFFARSLIAGGGTLSGARAFATEWLGADHRVSRNLTEEVRGALKAVVSGATTANAGALVGYQQMVVDFTDSLKNLSAFDVMKSSMKQIPLHIRVSLAVVTAPTQGTVPGEAAWKPVTEIELRGADGLPLLKGVVVVVINAELAKAGAQELLSAELRGAAAAAADKAFVPALTDTSTVSIAATGSTASDFLNDLGAALRAMQLGARSRLFLLVDPQMCAALACLSANGTQAFPDLTPLGGTVAGVQVVPTDAIASGDDLLLVDATQLAGGDETTTLDVSRQADVLLDNSPPSQPNASSVLTSMFQTNRSALKAERWFGFVKLRDGAVVAITNPSYGSVES